jgi:hypothetical protein
MAAAVLLRRQTTGRLLALRGRGEGGRGESRAGVRWDGCVAFGRRGYFKQWRSFGLASVSRKHTCARPRSTDMWVHCWARIRPPVQLANTPREGELLCFTFTRPAAHARKPTGLKTSILPRVGPLVRARQRGHVGFVARQQCWGFRDCRSMAERLFA